jgi:hypothetical protein
MEGPPLTPVASKTKDWNPFFLVVPLPDLRFSPALIVIAAPVFVACFILSIIAPLAKPLPGS